MRDASDVRDRRAQTPNEHRDAGRHERERHRREDRPPKMPKPGQTGDEQQQQQRERDPLRRKTRNVVDHRRGASRCADRDREHKVDDQRADRHERPRLPERLARCRGSPAALREPRHELVIVGDHQRDDRDHQPHRRQQQSEVATQLAQRRLDRIRNRRHRISHHRKRERDQQNRTAVKRATRTQPSGRAAITDPSAGHKPAQTQAHEREPSRAVRSQRRAQPAGPASPGSPTPAAVDERRGGGSIAATA